MDFKSAEALMDEGKKVRREGMPEGHFGYKSFIKIQDRVEFRFTRPGDTSSTWEPTEEDRAAEDWVELVEETAETPPDAGD